MLVLKIKKEISKVDKDRTRVINKTAELLVRTRIRTGRDKDREMSKEWDNKVNKDRMQDATRARVNKEVDKVDKARDGTRKDRARDKKPRALNLVSTNKLAAWALRA